MFNLTRKFRREYDRLFRKDPVAANVLLLLCELADEKGQVETNEEELVVLLNARFGNNPRRYSL